MHDSIDLTIAPSDKYREVIVGEPVGDEAPETEEEYIEQSEHHEAAEAYLQTIGNIQDPGRDAEERDALSWAHIGVSNDPDLVAKMATYFDGMYADEPTDRLRAKLRLLDVEVYANVQIAARQELRQ